MQAVSEQSFDGVVFAGGGCRCFWQAGFYSEAAPRLQLEPQRVSAASAGAALACVSLTGKADSALHNFKRHAKNNQKNLYPERLFSKKPIFPHEQLFRSAITETIDDDAFESLRSGPEFQVALTRAPASPLGVAPRLFAGLFAYRLERIARGRVHSQWPKRVGLSVEWARVDHCENIDALSDLLLQTSCTPPFTPPLSRNGRPVLDGGLTDNVPVAALPESRRVLVLLTRKFDRLPVSDRVTYAQPSRPIPIGVWDYTQPEAIQDAYDLGRRDGEAFARQQQV